jgi:hypothetical protein
MFFRELIWALAGSRLWYCIVGGVAVNLHGVPRLTYDLDIVVVPEAFDLQELERLLVQLGLRCRLPINLADLADPQLRQQLLAERNLVVVTFTDPNDPMREIDVLVSPPIPGKDLVERAMTLDLDGTAVPIASLSDLIALKRMSGRAQDLDDAAQLERIQTEDEDG